MMSLRDVRKTRGEGSQRYSLVIPRLDLQDAKTKHAAAQQIAATGQSQVNAISKNPDLGDWAPWLAPMCKAT